jgi:hypothetical protein
MFETIVAKVTNAVHALATAIRTSPSFTAAAAVLELFLVLP